MFNHSTLLRYRFFFRYLHSALKRQLKAEKKAREKETVKAPTATPLKVEVAFTLGVLQSLLGACLFHRTKMTKQRRSTLM